MPSLNVEVTVPLKCLSKFGTSVDLPSMNSEVELDLLLTKDCVLIKHHNSITGVTFIIAGTKIFSPVVTLSINDNIKFLENLK